MVSVAGAGFCLSEAKLGLLPATIGPYVVKAIGERQARRYFTTAERFDAATAQRLGLAHEVADGVEALDAKVAEAHGTALRQRPDGGARGSAWRSTSATSRSARQCAMTPHGASPTSAPPARGAPGCRVFWNKTAPPWL